jgi:hypothetical protein
MEELLIENNYFLTRIQAKFLIRSIHKYRENVRGVAGASVIFNKLVKKGKIKKYALNQYSIIDVLNFINNKD